MTNKQTKSKVRDIEQELLTRRMRRAYEIATHSPDPSTQNGATIARGPTVLADGCNTFPPHIAYRLERPAKYTFIEHAERSAIHVAAFDGHATAGAKMFCLWAACAECARAIIGAGIRELVTHEFYLDKGTDHWNATIADAKTMFAESGVTVTYTDVQVMKKGESLLFNGEAVHF